MFFSFWLEGGPLTLTFLCKAVLQLAPWRLAINDPCGSWQCFLQVWCFHGCRVSTQITLRSVDIGNFVAVLTEPQLTRHLQRPQDCVYGALTRSSSRTRNKDATRGSWHRYERSNVRHVRPFTSASRSPSSPLGPLS